MQVKSAAFVAARVLSVALAGFAMWATSVIPAAAQGPFQLNENCIVSVLNRNTRVRPDGSWVLPNIPANFGLVRARATCVFNGVTVSGESSPFLVLANQSVNVPPIQLGSTTPIPTALQLTATPSQLAKAAQTGQVNVLAQFSDGTSRDVSAASTGTLYVISNPAIATITGNGLVTALASGTALVQATHEGTSGFTSIRVVLTSDTDGDKIPDDLELALGLNPNNAADALEDPDRDNLNNLGESLAGTQLQNPDSDTDGIFDGEEVSAGGDKFITNPLLSDTDGDGVRDGLEIASGSDPTDSLSLNLAKALKGISVTPETFTITVNSVQGEGFRQLTVTGALQDGSTINLTPLSRGTNYSSSDLNVCNFGAEDGRVFGVDSGPCRITVTNNGHTDFADGTVIGFQPRALSFVSLPGFANNVDVAGNFAYVASGAAGLQVVNVSNRANPVIVGAVDTPGNANDVVVLGNFAYVADGSQGLQVINISNPATPQLVASYDTPGDAWDVVVSNSRAYIADGDAGLVILDVTNPSEPTLLGSFNPPGIQKGVAVDPSRNIAVLASGTQGLHVINVSNPASAVQLSALPGGDVRDVTLQNQHAFLADYERSFTSVDLSSPATPVFRDSTPLDTGGRLHDVVVQGNFGLGADVLFVNGVPIVAVDSPDNLVVRARLDFIALGDSDGQGIAADAGYVYLAAVGGSAFTENGTSSSASRLYIGQYLAIEDRDGVAPSVSIVQPLSNTSVIEGTPVSVRINATDDIAVAAVTVRVNGTPVATDGSEPYEFVVTAPPAPGPLVLGATAIDFGNNTGTAANVMVTVTPDPLTTVTGTVVDAQGNPVIGATVTLITFKTTTGPGGTFSIPNVPTVLGKLVARASAVVGDKTLRGASTATTPVPNGTTNVGTITLRSANVLLLADTMSVGTNALVAALENAGIPVTVFSPEYSWSGTPALNDFSVVVHLNGSTYGQPLPQASQLALVAFVNNGGGFVGAQWNGFERASSGTQVQMNDLVLRGHADAQSQNCAFCTVTYTVVPGQESHPVLAGLPNSFTFDSDGHDASAAFSFASNQPVPLMRVGPGGPGVLVRQVGSGRVVDFSIAASYGGSGVALQNVNVQQLYINAVLWVSGK